MRSLGLAASVAVMAAMATFPAMAGERMLVTEMPGWRVIERHADDRVETLEMIPASETKDGWTRRVTVQAFRGSGLSASAFLDGLIERTGEVCDGMKASPIRPTPMAGAEAGRRAIACGRFKGDGKGTYTEMLAVRGKSALFVLARAWRGPAFNPETQPVPIEPEEMAAWDQTFQSARLCDDDDPKRACER